MAILQLQEMIPVGTPLGDGYALILETQSHDHYWTVALGNGARVTFRQDQLRIANSYTHGRGITDAQMKTHIKR